MLSLKEEDIIVAAYETVEGGQFGGSEAMGVPWCNLSILSESEEVSTQLDVQIGQTSTHYVVCYSQKQLLEDWRWALVVLNQVAPVLLGGDCAVAHGRGRVMKYFHRPRFPG